MKNISDTGKQEQAMDNGTANKSLEHLESEGQDKEAAHIQKIQPLQTATAQLVPGGCRPTGT